MDDILSLIRTKEDVNELCDEIDLLLQSLFRSKKNTFDDVLREKVRSRIADKMLKAISANHFDIKNRQAVEDFLKELKEEAEKFTIFKLTLSFDPTGQLIDKIHQFANRVLGKGVILDIEKDPTLLGGAVLEYKGKYIDLSVKKKMEEIDIKTLISNI